MNYIETVTDNMDFATKHSLTNFPMPIVIYSINTNLILWSNSKFNEASGDRDHLFERPMPDVVPGYDGKWLAEGKSECPVLVELLGRKYKYTEASSAVRRTPQRESLWPPPIG